MTSVSYRFFYDIFVAKRQEKLYNNPIRSVIPMSMEKLNAMNGVLCSCGKTHTYDTQVYVGKGVVENIPAYLRQYNPKKVFVLSDPNTYKAAGEKVCGILEKSGMAYTAYSFTHDPIEPDEYSVGSMMMHYDTKCDVIVAVGSGVVNDLGKILSNISGKPYMIVGTAPSMDGYASATSSMTRDGLKTSLPSRSADIIVGDVDILCQAPMHMMKAGLGDMLAKYVSICEWRIANLLVGEYYCEEIAQLIRGALKSCVDNAAGLLRRDETAVQAVFEGLVIGGVAMNYAGLSRRLMDFADAVCGHLSGGLAHVNVVLSVLQGGCSGSAASSSIRSCSSASKRKQRQRQ